MPPPCQPPFSTFHFKPSRQPCINLAPPNTSSMSPLSPTMAFHLCCAYLHLHCTFITALFPNQRTPIIPSYASTMHLPPNVYILSCPITNQSHAPPFTMNLRLQPPPSCSHLHHASTMHLPPSISSTCTTLITFPCLYLQHHHASTIAAPSCTNHGNH